MLCYYGRLNSSTRLSAVSSRSTDLQALWHSVITPFPVAFFKFFCLIAVYISLAAMDPSSDGDGKCFTVQLDGSDSTPRAQKVISTLRLDVGPDDLHSNKTILRLTFTTRRYNVERDGRLTSLAKAIE